MYPLSKIVLGVPANTDSDHKYICSENVVESLLFAASRSELFARKGHSLTVNLPAFSTQKSARHSKRDIQEGMELKVLDCQPLTHGVVTVNTEIILSKMNSKHVAGTEHPVPLVVSDFAKCLSLKRRAGTQNNIQSDHQESTLRCTVVLDSSQFMRRQYSDIDLSNVIGLSKDTLMRPGLFSDSLVCVTIHPNEWDFQCLSKTENQTTLKYERIARVLMIDCAPDTAIMLPILWFNLTKGSKLDTNNNCITLKV